MKYNYNQNNMNIVIFTTRADKSLDEFVSAANKLQIGQKHYFYEELSIENNQLQKNNQTVNISDSKVILRDPYNTGIDYSKIFKFIIENNYDSILIDRQCYKVYPDYEDKLFQSKFLTEGGFRTPKTFFNPNLEEVPLPIFLKKRISSRNKGNELINDREELRQKYTEDYILQEPISFNKDLRVLIYKDKILGVIERAKLMQMDGTKKLKVIGRFDKLEDSIRSDALKVVSNLKADFVGIDILYNSEDDYYFLELNLSPQFYSFKSSTGINPAEIILQDLV